MFALEAVKKFMLESKAFVELLEGLDAFINPSSTGELSRWRRGFIELQIFDLCRQEEWLATTRSFSNRPVYKDKIATLQGMAMIIVKTMKFSTLLQVGVASINVVRRAVIPCEAKPTLGLFRVRWTCVS